MSEFTRPQLQCRVRLRVRLIFLTLRGYLHVRELESTVGTQYRVQHQARERTVDHHLHAPTQLGVRRDRDPVVGDRSDDGRVLQKVEDRVDAG
jgi:hypothetical protein